MVRRAMNPKKGNCKEALKRATSCTEAEAMPRKLLEILNSSKRYFGICFRCFSPPSCNVGLVSILTTCICQGAVAPLKPGGQEQIPEWTAMASRSFFSLPSTFL